MDPSYFYGLEEDEQQEENFLAARRIMEEVK